MGAKYGAGYRILECERLGGDTMGETRGADVFIEIEKPDGMATHVTIHTQHVPSPLFYYKAPIWLKAELDAGRLTVESIPSVWDADMMNRIEK